MNTKGSKGIIGITLALIMIASIFAAIAPVSALDYTSGKSTLTGEGGAVDNSLQYYKGDTVYWRVTFTPTSEAITLTHTYDNYPDGTSEDFVTTNTPLANGTTYTEEMNWTIPTDWPNATITNDFIIQGLDVSGTPFTTTIPKTSIILTEPPELFVDSVAIGCFEVEFTGWASDNASIVNFTWDFGAGESPRYVSGTGPLPNTTTHTFATCGPKTISLTACNADDCATEPHSFTVACEPTAAATYSPMCFEMNGSDITFTGSASGGTSPYAYQWEFSDGLYGASVAETTRPVNAPLNAMFTVTDDLGCSDSTNVSIVQCAGCSLRLYGTYGEGAGDDQVVDPYTGLAPENWPYSDPEGPFYPQHWQAPRKDFITFNPAMMDHNQNYTELSWKFCNDTEVQREKEKVFKRMWYEKEWFKDHDKDGEWDLVLVNGAEGRETITLRDWLQIPSWKRPEVREWNNDPTINDSNVDIYGPTVVQEFTYMFTDDETMP